MSNPFDDDIEQAQKIKDFVKTNGIPIVIAVALSISGIVGWRWYQERQEVSATEAADLYQEYRTARGLSEPVDEYLQSLEQDHRNSPYRAFALLHEAKEHAQAEEWEAMLPLLDEALRLTKGNLISGEFALRKARVEIQLERYDEALQTLASVRGSGYRSMALDLSGDIHRVRRELGAARKAYEAAIENLSPSLSSNAITQKLASLPKTP